MGTRGMRNVVSLVLLFITAVMASATADANAQGAPGRRLPGCGICYPDGYDINTSGRVQGRLLDLEVPDEGPVRFVVAGEGERWVVLASPAWFWRENAPQFAVGDVATVRGSKTLGADGTLYIIAREIQSQGPEAVVLLRDRQGIPLWRGGHRGGSRTQDAPGPGRGRGTDQGRGRGRNSGSDCR